MVMDRLNAHKADNPSMGEVRCWDIYDALIVSLFFFINILYLATHILQTFFSFFNLKWHFLTAVSFSYSVFWTIFSSLCFFPLLVCQLIFSWASGGCQCKSCFCFFVMLCWIYVLFTSNLSSVFPRILPFICWNFRIFFNSLAAITWACSNQL